MEPIRLELPTPFAVGSVNTYLFTEPEIVLVDTGVDSDDSWQVLLAGLANYNLTMADVQRVIITHAHVDHLGAAARITQHSNAQVWIADMGYDWLVDPVRKWQERIDYYQDSFLKRTGMSLQAQEMVIAYMSFAAQSSILVSPDRITRFKAGDKLALGGQDWEVLHMPGHASHQTCFYTTASGQFISADMLLHIAPTPIVEAPVDGRTRIPSLPIFLESLDRVENLNLKIVYPGHGDIITNPYDIIQRQRERIQQRKAETLELVRQGYETVIDLVNIMYAHYPDQARISGLWMLVGYLDLLKAENAIVEKEMDGVWHYAVVGD